MPKPRGLPHTGGREKGTLNKVTYELREAAAKYTPAALQTLQSIMTNPRNPAAARCMAASILLDRAHGRAHQSISADVTAQNEHRYVVEVPPTLDNAEWKLFLQYKRGELPPEQAPPGIAAMLVDGDCDWQQRKRHQAKQIEAKPNGKSEPQINQTRPDKA